MTDQNITLRIIVENPPVRFKVQRGKDELLVGTHSGGVWHLKRTCLLAAK